MIDLFKGTGNICEDIVALKEYLNYKYKSNKLIETKNKEKIYLVHENDNSEDKANYRGQIYVLSNSGIIGLLVYEAIRNPHVITIKNIHFSHPDYYGIGIGTGLIKYLQEYAITEEVKLIKGILDQYDIDHYRDTLMNFYAKHDFNIDFYHREVKKIISNTLTEI